MKKIRSGWSPAMEQRAGSEEAKQVRRMSGQPTPKKSIKHIMPRVLNKHRDHIPPDAVYCGRPGPWGNPYEIGKHGTRDEVCDRFEREILPTLDVTSLRGRDLVCWCAPLRCHCDAILRKANAAILCEECGIYPADPPSRICPGCEAYSEHQA